MKLKPLTFALLLSVTLALSTLCFMDVLPTYALPQNADIHLTVEQYTDSDYLLNEDGENSNRTIFNFAEDVKKAAPDRECPEITQVVPNEYLESLVNTDFYYCGREYGFFLHHEGAHFYLLLIDFECTPISDNQYKLKITPILQQSFARAVDYEGRRCWIKRVNYENYYVANPKFLTALQNENDLNHGDDNYSKLTDQGLIIQQTRMNFKNVMYVKDMGDYVFNTEYLADIAVDTTFMLIESLAEDYAGKVISLMEYIYSTGKSLTDAVCVNEKTITEDHENYLFTERSKDYQMKNNSFESYSRLVANGIEDETVLYEKDQEENPYIETIVLLNNTNYRSRLTQICDFEIIKKEPGSAIPEYVTYTDGEGTKNLTMSFSNTATLFDDEEPKRKIDYTLGDATAPAYLCPDGDQTLDLKCRYSGDYSFIMPEGVTADVDGTEISNKCYLKGGVKHTLKIKNDSSADYKIFDLVCKLDNSIIIGDNNLSLKQNDCAVFKIDSPQDAYYVINITNPKVKIENASKISDTSYFIYINANEPYLILTNSDLDTTTQLNFSEPTEVLLHQNVTANAGNYIYKFVNPYNSVTSFEILVPRNNVDTVLQIINSDNEKISTTTIGEDSIIVSTTLSANQKCYIVTSFIDTPIFQVGIAEDQLRWLIDNKIVENGRCTLPRGKTYDVSLKRVEGNNLVNVSTNININSDSIYWVTNDTKIIIQYEFPVNEEIFIYPDCCPRFGLKIFVDLGEEMSVTFEKCGGIGGDDSVYIRDKIVTDPLNAPERIGYDFCGYFSGENGSGTMYFDENMNLISAHKGTIILYAFWKKQIYTIKIIYNDDSGFTSTEKVSYGDPMPELGSARERKGYKCAGLFYDIKGKGEDKDKVIETIKFYEVENYDDKQRADIEGVNHYYYQKFKSLNKVWDRYESGTLYAVWERLTGAVSYECREETGGPFTQETFQATHGASVYVTAKNISGYTFKYFLYKGTEYYETSKSFVFELYYSHATGAPALSTSFYAIYEKQNCVAKGTLITLADGSQVPVENLTGRETLLVWNFSTGEYDSAEILFIDKDPLRVYNVISLGFSDGTTVKVISEHGFFDLDLNEFVYLGEDAGKYIGHWFNKQTVTDGKLDWRPVQLVSVNICEETTEAYSPVTSGHLCYYVNGVLSMPGGITGLFNIFEVDETMTIDAVKAEADIAEYGLFTYEEFAELIPVTEEVFNAFNAKYFKVAIGKGLIDLEGIGNLASRYSEFFGNI